MSTRAKTFYIPGAGNISCSQAIYGGQFILSANNHPALFMFSMPADIAVELAKNILEQASATCAGGA